MNSIEEIFENGKAEELSIDPFDVEEWAAGKKAEREQAYSLIAAMAKSVSTYGDKLKSYLDVQSRFNKYSVGKFNSKYILIFHLDFNEKMGLGINNEIKSQLIPFIHFAVYTLVVFFFLCPHYQSINRCINVNFRFSISKF